MTEYAQNVSTKQKFESEQAKLNELAKNACNTLIDMRAKSTSKLHKWSDQPAHLDGLNGVTKVGFTDVADERGVEFGIDVVAQDGKTENELRIMVGMSKDITDTITFFNNVSISFAISPELGKATVAKGDKIMLNDFRKLLESESTQLSSLILSDNTEFDPNSQKITGTRLDAIPAKNLEKYLAQNGLISDEMTGETVSIDKVRKVLYAVLSVLKNSTNHQAG